VEKYECERGESERKWGLACPLTGRWSVACQDTPFAYWPQWAASVSRRMGTRGGARTMPDGLWWRGAL
jgi:hypothetical protein